MRNINLRIKMLIFSVMAAALILLVWALSVSLFENTKIGSKLYDEIMLSNELTTDIKPPVEYVIEAYAVAQEYIGTDGSDQREELYTSFQALKQAFQERYLFWDAHITDNEMRQVFLKDAHDSAVHFFDVFENEVVPAGKNYNAVQMKMAQRNLKTAYTEHRAAIDKTLTLSDNWRTGLLKTAEETTQRDNFMLNIIVICGLLACVAVSLLITLPLSKTAKYVTGVMERIAEGDLSATINDRYISRDEMGRLCLSTKRTAERLNGYLSYINEITAVLNSMAAGDMRIRLANDYSGEFAAIKQALLEIASSLNNTLNAITVASSQVNAGAKRISEEAQTLSHGVQTQASSIEQLTSSIESVSVQAKDNANNVKKATEYVSRAVVGIGQSNETMHKMLDSMDRISKTSGEIGQIIKVIDDIAFQTNILALNAAVEAARAGSAGSGFAVVAGEVRNLAGKSSEAAKQTTRLIEASLKAISGGAKYSEDTAKELEEVAREAEQIKAAIAGIETASATQAAAIEQIKQGLKQISDVVQSNAAASEESASASEEMFSQSTLLKEEVDKFTLDGMM